MPKATPSLSESYRRAWDSCIALWPLFILRSAYVVTNCILFISCLLLGLWPILRVLLRGLEAAGPDQFEDFLVHGNWIPFFSDFHWLTVAVASFFLYCVSLNLLAAFFNGALYSQLSKYQKRGSWFTIEEFFNAGLDHFLPMLGAQIGWLLIFLGTFVLDILGTIGLGDLLGLFGMPGWLMFLLAIPIGFASILLLTYLIVSMTMTGAYVVSGMGVLDSMEKAMLKAKENGGRVLWGFLLTYVIYMVLSLALKGILTVFSHTLLIGFIFSLIDVVVSLGLFVMFSVFSTALAVTFRLEKDA